MGNSLPVDGASPVTLAQADRDGPSVDTAAIPPGRSAYVRSSAITGDGAKAGALYFVDDSGVIFGLPDEDTAKHLGLTGAPVAAPWPVLARLPRGPELSKDAASIARDSIAGRRVGPRTRSWRLSQRISQDRSLLRRRAIRWLSVGGAAICLAISVATVAMTASAARLRRSRDAVTRD